MPRLTSWQTRELGEQFVQFLKDTGRQAISNKEQLKTIYNQEFRNRDGIRGPNFSSVLYVLGQFGGAKVRKTSVQFGPIKKVELKDQYWRPNKNAGDQPNGGQNAKNGPPPHRSRAKGRAEFTKKKNGVNIVSEHDLQNGRIRFPVTPNERKTITLTIKNSGVNEVTLHAYKKLRRCRELTFKATPSPPVILPPGSSYEVQVDCLAPGYGYFLSIVEFKFSSEQDGPFIIGRFISAVAKTKLAEELGPTAKYQPYQAKLHRPHYFTTEDGIPPDNSLSYELELKTRLEKHNYPPNLKDLVDYLDEGHAPDDATHDKVTQLRSILGTELQFDKYHKKFELLLHLEEIQMEVDIHRYDMHDVCMDIDKHRKDLLVLKAPGVAENRPSVLKGDHLFVVLVEDLGHYPVTQYTGYVHAVELEKVKLGFSKKLLSRFINNMKFDVTFTFNRLPLRVQHRAVLLAQERQLHDLLFPSFSYGESLLSAGQSLSLYDRSLNEEQRKAVLQVVSGLSRPAPYLIFGPPGTGKTVTMVEAIKQVLRCLENSHVLACAPSNSAADLLCQHLQKHVEKRKIYRMNASSRDYGTIPEDIKPYCNWDTKKNCPVFPAKEKLKEYKVIITTLITAGRLVSADFPAGHFTHVFIDESGHAVEPESLIAIAGILDVTGKENSKVGQLVLAGDHQQLGPVLRSPQAIKNGLEMSLLERLMKHNSLYQKKNGSYNPQFVTKLLRNYRSHAAILKFPNDEFYEGELLVCADEIVTNVYCTWKELGKQGFPIIFHGVHGEDQREERSPSFFNADEINVLIDYLKKLLLEEQGKKGVPRISPKEIGIISPYRKQVEKIRQAIKSERSGIKNLSGIKDLKVGSVEEFQGQERRVLLISTVRSSSEYLALDEKFNLGFLKNPKRFNVAVTRAKALLIIIGNPVTLGQDKYWGGIWDCDALYHSWGQISNIPALCTSHANGVCAAFCGGRLLIESSTRFLKYCIKEGGYRGYPYVEDENEEDENLAAELHSLSLNAQPTGSTLRESHIQQQVAPEWRHEF